MKLIVSISLVGCALSYAVQGGLLSNLLGNVHLEINACPHLVIDLSGNSARDAQPVFQSTNPACPNYVPPNEIVDSGPEPNMQDTAPVVPVPGIDAPAIYPASYNAVLPESVTKAPAGSNVLGAWPGASYNSANPPALPILVNNVPPLVADTAAAYNGGSPAPVPVNPGLVNTSPGVSYNAANPPALPILVNSEPPLVPDTAAVYNGGSPGLNPVNALPSVGYNAANTLPLPTQFAGLPPLVADAAAGGRYNAVDPIPAQLNNLPPLVADTAVVNTDSTPTIKPETVPFVPAVVPEAIPAAIPTSKCASRSPANNYRSSAMLSSGPLEAPAVPANTATARYSGEALDLGPESLRQPINPAVQQDPGYPKYVNTHGAAGSPIAAMPTTPVAPEIPRIRMPTTFAPVNREPVAAGQFFGQHIETTVTVTALEDLPLDVLHAVRNVGSFEFSN
ncbi:hypothetical protein GGI16_003052 [Coemansia sp. S142-1]|nr:hypothetical protein LPJ71_001474 [Coemansia sp. S17]KAJ2103129.1 hypothetical protein GGI16_003052 [Coemansia sp. S142-1]